MDFYGFSWLWLFKKSSEHNIVILGFYNLKTDGTIVNRLSNPFVLACLLQFNENKLIDLLIFAKLI